MERFQTSKETPNESKVVEEFWLRLDNGSSQQAESAAVRDAAVVDAQQNGSARVEENGSVGMEENGSVGMEENAAAGTEEKESPSIEENGSAPGIEENSATAIEENVSPAIEENQVADVEEDSAAHIPENAISGIRENGTVHESETADAQGSASRALYQNGSVPTVESESNFRRISN